jgi:BASS family bile acid:Na+ symporter
VALPEAVVYPDADYLVLCFVACVGLCAAALAVGWRLAAWLSAGRAEQTSLMYALGMSNNGTGLVLAAGLFADRPQVLLPVAAYNLVQHVIAGVVNRARQPHGGGAA